MYILGLDISTSYIGWNLIDFDDNVIDYGYIKVRHNNPEINKNLYRKTKVFVDEFKSILSQYKDKISIIAVEAALKKFASKRSSTQTINKLIAYNFWVCNYLYNELGIEPIDIATTTARSRLGIKVPRGLDDYSKKCYVRDKIAEFYPTLKWEKGRTGRYKPYCFDISDSFVISKAILCTQKKP